MLKILKQPFKNYKEQDNDKNRGKKRYRKRIVEEQEAEQEIKEYDRQEPIDRVNDSHSTRLANSN